MASITRYLPVLAVLVISTSNNAAGHRFLCRRLYPLEVTASHTPCRYYCAHFDGRIQRILVLGEQDGTPCVAQSGSPGVCRFGMCLNALGPQSDGSRKIPASSQMPLRIRKRDTKGLVGVKNSSPGSSMENSAHLITKTLGVKTGAHTDGSMVKGMKTASTNGMPDSSGRSAVTANLPEDINPFALPSEPTSSPSTNGPLSQPRGQTGGSHVPGADAGAFNTAENGPVGITKPEVTKGSVDTLTYLGGSIHQPSGSPAPSLLPHVPRTSMPRFPGGMSMPTATGVHPRPITGSTITSGTQGPVVSLPSRAPGSPDGFSNAPSPSGVNSINAGMHTPFTTSLSQPHPGTTTPRHLVPAVGVTGSGLEVEMPGFTTGLDGRWKWVLARRTGIFPPYIQAIDPEILYYKLGYPLPNLPVLPEYVQKLLNNVPMSPAGSSIYGYRGSTTIVDIIRKVARITALKKLLSSSQTSHRTKQTKLLATLLARETSSPLGASPIERLLLQGDSQLSPVQPELWSSLISLLGSNPYGSFPNSPYAGPFGSPYSSFYAGIYGSPYGPLSGFPNTPFPRGPWPYYTGSPPGPSGAYGPGSDIYSSFSSYGAPSSPSYRGFPGYGASPLSRNIFSTLSGIVSGTAPGRTTTPVFDPFFTSGSIYPRATNAGNYNLPRTSTSTILTEVIDQLAHPWQYTRNPDGSSVRKNELEIPGLTMLSPMLRDPSIRLYNLLKIIRAPQTSIDRLIRPGGTYPDMLNLLRQQPSSPIDNTLIKQVILRQQPGSLGSLLNSRVPNGNERDAVSRMIALLQGVVSNPKDSVAQYLAQLAGVKPDSSEFSPNKKGPLGSTTDILTLLRALQQPQGGSPQDPLVQLLLRAQESQRSTATRNPFATAGYIGTPQDFSTFRENQPGFPGSRPLAKGVDDTLLTVSGPRKTPMGTKSTGVSEPATPSQLYSSTLPRDSIFKEQLVSHTSSPGVQPAMPSFIAPATSGLHVTKQVVQQLTSPTLLRVSNVPGVSRHTMPLYTSHTLQPFYTTGARVTSTPGVFANGQYFSSTNGLLGTALGQTGSPLTGAAYTTSVPVTAGYVSATTSSHPYLLDGSQLGIHPHYIVEGHEAPGTRWQLKVWRNHPGVSTIVPGVSGYTSYVSSSPTIGVLGPPTLTGIPVTGSTTSSHYFVQSGSTGGNHMISPISSNAPSYAFMPGTQSMSGTTPASGNSGGGIYAASPMTSTSYTGYSYSATHGSDSNSGLTSGTSGGGTSNLLGRTEASSPFFSSSSGSDGMTEGISNTKMKR